MKRIELEIVADNSQYIKSTQEVTQATTTMQKTIQKGEQRTKGLIEDTTDALKDYEEKRKKAFTIEGVEKYNRKIAEAKKTLQEYNKAGLETATAQEKIATSTNSAWKSFIKFLGPILTVTAALKIFKGILNSTQTSGDALKNTIGGLKTSLDTFFRSVATGNFKDLRDRLKDAGDAGVSYTKALDQIGDRERELSLIDTRRQGEMIELAKIYRNTGLIGVEGYKKREEAAKRYIELAEQGEADALEILNMRRDAELILAREQAGFTKEYENASEERRKAINNEIIANLELQSTFDTYQKDLDNITRLYKNIDTLLGPIGRRNENLLPPQAIELIRENRAELAKYPPAVMAIYEQYKIWGNVTDDTRQRLTDSLNAIEVKQNEVAQGTIRANTMAELAGVRIADAESKTLEEREKNLEKFLEATMRLQNEYEKAVIEGLTGTEKIAAERDYQLRQYDMLQAHLESLGTLTEDHYKMIEGLRAKAIRDAEIATRQEQQATTDFWTETYDKAIEQRMKFLDFREELDLKTAELAGELTGEKELEIQKKWLQARIDLLKSSQDPILQQQAELLELQLGLIDKELTGKKAEKTIWDYIGLGDSEEAQEAIKNSVDTIKNVLDDIFAARLEDAQRTRELYDTQIAETQRALDTETRLMEDGFANNVDAKRKELEQLKVAREAALREEEKALKAQRALDTISQLSSLITASADIFKAMAKLGPIGVAIAVGTIATMFGAFAIAKTKAAQVTKLAAGGVGDDTGVITGRTHKQGGERFLDHVEVERGEMFGVLNRRASMKHGKAFTEIVNNFNRDNLVVDRSDSVNNINIDVNGLSERLDKVEYQLIRQNEFIMSRSNVQDYPTMRIEKRGNKTRIIRK